MRRDDCKKDIFKNMMISNESLHSQEKRRGNCVKYSAKKGIYIWIMEWSNVYNIMTSQFGLNLSISEIIQKLRFILNKLIGNRNPKQTKSYWHNDQYSGWICIRLD